MGIAGISGEVSAWQPKSKNNKGSVNADFTEELENKTGNKKDGSKIDNKSDYQTANIQEIYIKETANMTAYHKGKPLEGWSEEDFKYTDEETGISWYVRDGKYPYMTGEDAEKFEKMCEETGEFPLKKFAEMTGLIRHMDDNTIVYIGDNGLGVKGKDGRELFVDTSNMTYDAVMKLFDHLPFSDNYYDANYWREQIIKIQG